MARHNISERWVRDIEAEVEDFENFEANSQWRKAVVEIFDEVYDVGGIAPVEQLGNWVMEVAENKRHPTSSRVRSMARRALQEHDEEIPPTSILLKSRNG